MPEKRVVFFPAPIPGKAAVMGKLKEDMLFLEKIAQHPTLSTNTFDIKLNQRRKCKKDITSTAQDGLTFLEIRSCFWETSGNSALSSGQQNDSSRRKRS